MNRDQAIKAVADKIGISGPFTDSWRPPWRTRNWSRAAMRPSAG